MDLNARCATSITFSAWFRSSDSLSFKYTFVSKEKRVEAVLYKQWSVCAQAAAAAVS